MPNPCHDGGALIDIKIPIPNVYPRNNALTATCKKKIYQPEVTVTHPYDNARLTWYEKPQNAKNASTFMRMYCAACRSQMFVKYAA